MSIQNGLDRLSLWHKRLSGENTSARLIGSCVALVHNRAPEAVCVFDASCAALRG